ncbi:MAG: GGDEF domain-containing protein [Acholeplasmataceae bacterium]|nr:GGDEF domain-containing protein [Acholeplasmataceae bacterium]
MTENRSENFIYDVDFIERILKGLPANIFFKDTECRYVFCTHYWRHLKKDKAEDWTIRGKTDLEVRIDSENAEKAYEEDKKILETGCGTKYVIEINQDGILEYLEINKHPVRNEKDEIIGIVGLIIDVTDRVLMEKELRNRARTDMLTGLGNRDALEHWIAEIMPSERFPVGIIMIDCDGLKEINDTYGHSTGDEFIKMTGSVLKMSLPENAKIFRSGGDEFLITVPGAGLDECLKYMEAAENSGDIRIKSSRLSFSYGLSVLNSAEDNIKKAMDDADIMMYQKKKLKREANRN